MKNEHSANTVMAMLLLVLTGGLMSARAAAAGNIDLATVPDRASVQLTIYNSEDLTLVRETREIVFKRGNNPLQFSWANTLIDPTSVQLRFLDQAESLEVLDTTFPHDRPQELTWNIASEIAGPVTVEISYFTSGVSWSADYTVIAEPDESAARVEGYVTVSNQSGEDYEKAQVRLVVGTINLVEQIAELARNAGRVVDELPRRDYDRMRQNSARAMVQMAEGVGGAPADAMPATAPKEIVKQGLSEYFIFTIEGTETVPTNSRKRLPSFTADAVPLDVEYRYRPQGYGDRLVRMFLMTNDTESQLGASPLPDGQVRLFRRQGGEGRGLAFVARQAIRYIPVGEEIELNLGTDPDVGFELSTLRVYRDNIWLRLRTPNIVRKVGEPGVEFDDRSTVVGWDEHAVMQRRVRNDSGRPILIEVREAFAGDVVFVSDLDAQRHDNQTVTYRGELEPGQEIEARYEVVRREGRNAQQQRVEIVEQAVPAPRWGG